jgi:DNA repair protein RadC
MKMLMNYYLSDEELIERLFCVSKTDLEGKSVQEMIEHLISCQNENKEIWLIKELCQRYGERRLKKGSAFSTSKQVYDHFRVRLAESVQEMFLTITLDNKHRIIKEHLISLGTINKSLVHPREVFATAIEQRASGILLIHNHPAGDSSPSTQDKEITKRLSEVGKLVGIHVIDHLIIGAKSYYSFVDEGHLN